jgi:hypothetical protein
MKMYLAGNFPQMANPELEEEMMEKILEEGWQYTRLISFFYEKGAETVLNLKRKEYDGSQ